MFLSRIQQIQIQKMQQEFLKTIKMKPKPYTFRELNNN